MPYDDEDFSEEETENLKSANINPDEEKKSSRKSKANNEDKLHSDEEFDSYFKDKK